MLSVLIVNWNTRELLMACLRSLESALFEFDAEVIVVDNASTDGSAEAVSAAFPNVQLFAQKRNTGYAEGNNIAFGHARGDLLLTLNPDTEIPPDALKKVLDFAESHPNAGVIAPRLVGHDGQTQASVRGFPTFLGILGDITGLATRFPAGKLGSYRLPAFDYSREQLAPQPMGTFLLFRRAALESVGSATAPFDEEFPIFFNEVDLLFRLKKAGWDCVYTPEPAIRHLGGASTRQVRPMVIWESHRSLLRFFRKHYRTPANGWLFPFLALIVLGAAWVRARGYHAGFRP